MRLNELAVICGLRTQGWMDGSKVGIMWNNGDVAERPPRNYFACCSLDEKVHKEAAAGRKEGRSPAPLENRISLYHCTITSAVLLLLGYSAGACPAPPHSTATHSPQFPLLHPPFKTVQQNTTRIVGLTRYATLHFIIPSEFHGPLTNFVFSSFDLSSQSLSNS